MSGVEALVVHGTTQLSNISGDKHVTLANIAPPNNRANKMVLKSLPAMAAKSQSDKSRQKRFTIANAWTVKECINGAAKSAYPGI